ncbi:MAG: transglutaminase-like cysteine peptidase [Ketobacter sp.]
MLLWWLSLPLFAGNLSSEILHKVELEYGQPGLQRVARWERLIWDIRYHATEQQLKEVNDFFNVLRFRTDQDHWQQADYWATPVETLASNGGDCEDFAIAKYFTLRQLGVPARNMRITYVKALKINEPHMVLTYYPKQGEPLVLDILVSELLPASRRTDLLPVYSFNADGLWESKSRNEESLLGSADEIAMWRNLKQRLGMDTL